MFVSFFPRPPLFFMSAAFWIALSVTAWTLGAKDWGGLIGPAPLARGHAPIIGVAIFWSRPFLWFYLYYWASVAIFAGAWRRLIEAQPWARWSIWGSALIIFMTYLQVQVVPVPGQFLDHDRRAAVDPQTPAHLRARDHR